MDLNRHLALLRESIPEIDPRDAHALADTDGLLIDVREAGETAGGMAEHARPVPRGYLEMRIGDLATGTDQPLLLMCGSGTRSLLAADDLRRLGYDDVRSVAGGFSAWKAAGLPVVMPELDAAFGSGRYARQINLPEIGLAGQRRLAEARVLLVGAGGLGCPAGLYLAAAGVGTLGLVDDDRVERSNLHRQVLHRDDRVGWDKTASARATLTALNPEIAVHTHNQRLGPDNAADILGAYDLVVDGCDNFATRYLVSDTCRQLGLTSVYGAVQGFEGQVSVFAPGRGPCYRCLFADAPPPELAPSCSEAGVLGVAPGIIGLLQALEALKLIAGFGEPLIGRLLLFDARRSRLRELRLPADPECVCAASATSPDHVGTRGG